MQKSLSDGAEDTEQPLVFFDLETTGVGKIYNLLQSFIRLLIEIIRFSMGVIICNVSLLPSGFLS